MSAVDTASRPPSIMRRTARSPPASVDRRRLDGVELDRVVLDPEIFGIEPNVGRAPPGRHRPAGRPSAPAPSPPRPAPRSAAVGPSRSARRAPAAPDRARSARRTAPAAAIALGPKPRSYRQRTPKKMIRLALRSALSDRAAEGKVALVDDWSLRRARRPRTPWPPWPPSSLQGRVLVVARPRRRRRRPLLPQPARRARPCRPAELNAYDVLAHDWVVFTDATLPGETNPPATRRSRRPGSRHEAAATEGRPVAEAESAPLTPNRRRAPARRRSATPTTRWRRRRGSDS